MLIERGQGVRYRRARRTYNVRQSKYSRSSGNSGTVILEATLTAQGTVEEIKLVSGHPLLVEAAIECVKQWVYEPTYLNGIPVSVILTAKVHFLKAPVS